MTGSHQMGNPVDSLTSPELDGLDALTFSVEHAQARTTSATT